MFSRVACDCSRVLLPSNTKALAVIAGVSIASVAGYEVGVREAEGSCYNSEQREMIHTVMVSVNKSACKSVECSALASAVTLQLALQIGPTRPTLYQAAVLSARAAAARAAERLQGWRLQSKGRPGARELDVMVVARAMAW